MPRNKSKVKLVTINPVIREDQKIYLKKEANNAKEPISQSALVREAIDDLTIKRKRNK